MSSIMPRAKRGRPSVSVSSVEAVTRTQIGRPSLRYMRLSTLKRERRPSIISAKSVALGSMSSRWVISLKLSPRSSSELNPSNSSRSWLLIKVLPARSTNPMPMGAWSKIALKCELWGSESLGGSASPTSTLHSAHELEARRPGRFVDLEVGVTDDLVQLGSYETGLVVPQALDY